MESRAKSVTVADGSRNSGTHQDSDRQELKETGRSGEFYRSAILDLERTLERLRVDSSLVADSKTLI